MVALVAAASETVTLVGAASGMGSVAAIVAAMERSVAMALRWDWSLGQLRAPQWAPQWEQR